LSEPPAPSGPPGPVSGRTARGALAVGGGILASRVAGLFRAAATSAAFGVGPYADVFQTALRAPNILQNLLGEQALSASFIPVYSRFLARGDEEGGRRFAGAAFGLLVAAAGGLSLLGLLAAKPIVALFATGYLRDAAAVAAGAQAVDRFELAARAVRWIFPMTGFLVLSAWALGVLNSHRRFFLPYVAPVVWNASIIGGLWWMASGSGWGAWPDRPAGERLLFAACVGALVGGLLQFGVQLPGALRRLGGLRWSVDLKIPGVREALSAFAPALAGRGVVQLSSYLDQILASLLAVGAVSALGYAQMLYLLPVSLFGQAIAAAALPDLSRDVGGRRLDQLADRCRRSLAAVELLIFPSTVALAGFAAVAVAGLYRLLPGSRFGADDTLLVGTVLTIYALGLPASTSSRVLQSTFFALGDTRTPARVAALRVVIGAAVAVPAMFWLDRFALTALPGGAGFSASALRLGALGLAAGATIAAWSERFLLGRTLTRRLAAHRPAGRERLQRALVAATSAVPAALAALYLPVLHPTLRAAVVFGALAACYGGGILALGLQGPLGMSRRGSRQR